MGYHTAAFNRLGVRKCTIFTQYLLLSRIWYDIGHGQATIQKVIEVIT